jgi:hypothetical protein
MPLANVEALVLDPVAAVAVGVLEAEVVVVAQLLGKDVIWIIGLAFTSSNRRLCSVGVEDIHTIFDPNRAAVVLPTLDDRKANLLEVLALNASALAQALFGLLEDLSFLDDKDERNGVVLAGLLLEVETPDGTVSAVKVELLLFFGHALGIDGQELIERHDRVREWQNLINFAAVHLVEANLAHDLVGELCAFLKLFADFGERGLLGNKDVVSDFLGDAIGEPVDLDVLALLQIFEAHFEDFVVKLIRRLRGLVAVPVATATKKNVLDSQGWLRLDDRSRLARCLCNCCEAQER